MATTHKLKTLRPRLATLGTRLAPQPRTAERKPWEHRDASGRQLTATDRGYGWEWQRVRLVVLKRDNYLCLTCQRAGRLTVAREVDHVISKAVWLQQHGSLDGVDDPSNLESICTDDHKAKTARENGRTLRPRIGADGYPSVE